MDITAGSSMGAAALDTRRGRRRRGGADLPFHERGVDPARRLGGKPRIRALPRRREHGLAGRLSGPNLETETIFGTTWSETFPIAQTVTLPATQGSTLLVDHNIVISASYVIVRGLTLQNARTDAIRIADGDVHDVVIEGCDMVRLGRGPARNAGMAPAPR